MAGKILRRQYAVIGLAHGFVDMVWEQKYAAQPNNKTFSGARDRLTKHCDRMHTFLRNEGTLTVRDIKAIRDQINSLKDGHMPNGEFSPMLFISFIIDLIIEQIAFTKGEKKELFNSLLSRVRELERYFDRHKNYDDPAGLDMAEAFRRWDGKD